MKFRVSVHCAWEAKHLTCMHGSFNIVSNLAAQARMAALHVCGAGNSMIKRSINRVMDALAIVVCNKPKNLHCRCPELSTVMYAPLLL